ncbi:MAG: ATP synthase F0 subunit B [Bdellovibrionales bacterium]|nr:ATP synthase F0 subunit B [Bdellovibrionales bacterium]
MFILFIFSIFFSLSAHASSAAHAGIPWSLIVSQAVNFVALIILARLFLKKPISEYIKKQKQNFLLKEENVNKKANESKLLFNQWQEKWNKLSDSFTKKITQAKDNSLKLSEDNLVEAKKQTVNILEKAEVQVQTELSQAKVHLAQLLLQTSCNTALDLQKKQTSHKAINLSLLKNVNENKVFNEKN